MSEGYKMTELGELPEDWDVVKQEEVATFYNGRAYKLSEWENEGTPVIRLQNLTGSGSEYYYSNLKLPEHQYCHGGDLLYMWSATFGPVWWKGDKAIYHYHIWKIEVDEERLDKTFHYYLLDDVTVRMKNQSHGSTMLHVTKSGMEKTKIVLPPLKEQKKIAEILYTVDEKIEVIEQQIAQTTELKKGLMQQLLTKGIGHTQFKASPLGVIPESWEVTLLNNIADIKRGLASQHLSYVDHSSDGVRLIRINDFKSYDPKYIKETSETRKLTLEGDDILIAGTGATAGITVFVTEDWVGLPFSYNAPRIRVKSKVSPRFLYYYLNSDNILEQQQKLFTGNAQPFLDTKAIGNFKVGLPPLEEQNKIALIISSVDGKIQILQEKQAYFHDLKKGLMQQLLTGKLRVNHLIENEVFV